MFLLSAFPIPAYGQLCQQASVITYLPFVEFNFSACGPDFDISETSPLVSKMAFLNLLSGVLVGNA